MQESPLRIHFLEVHLGTQFRGRFLEWWTYAADGPLSCIEERPDLGALAMEGSGGDLAFKGIDGLVFVISDSSTAESVGAQIEALGQHLESRYGRRLGRDVALVIQIADQGLVDVQALGSKGYQCVVEDPASSAIDTLTTIMKATLTAAAANP